MVQVPLLQQQPATVTTANESIVRIDSTAIGRSVWNYLREWDGTERDLPAPERRAWHAAEVRVASSGDSPRIEGYAAVFNSPSEEIEEWGFRFTEIIRKGAFSKTLKEADIRALVNHDPNYVLGRNTAGTLTLTEDQKGLSISVSPPDTQWARDLQESMQRGDVNQMSFAFQVVKERYTEDSEQKRVLRELLEVKLFDISVVTYPAYPATSAVVRNLWQGVGIDFGQVTGTLLRQRAGLPLADDESVRIAGVIEALKRATGAEPDIHSLSAETRRRELKLLAIA